MPRLSRRSDAGGGKTIVSMAKELQQPRQAAMSVPDGSEFIPFTAQTRMSGVDLPDGHKIRKGATDAIIDFIKEQRGSVPAELDRIVTRVASEGATPLVVAEGNQIAGVVVLEDVLKPAMRERFDRLRRMGLRTVMITGDNHLTAATIAQKAGIDDFLAQATPQAKLAYIRKEQAEGKLVQYFRDSYSNYMRIWMDGNRQGSIGTVGAARTGAQGEESDLGSRRLPTG